MAKKHPKALPYLFLSEMWERFGFYLMLGIFFLYMTDTEKGGLAMGKKEAADIFGTYIALVYLTPFIGGLLADRILGYRLSITIGGILMGMMQGLDIFESMKYGAVTASFCIEGIGVNGLNDFSQAEFDKRLNWMHTNHTS